MTPQAAPRARKDAPPGEARRGASPATIGDLFLARLAQLERRVEEELDRAAPNLGPAGELMLDAVRQGWRAGSTLAALATGEGRRRALVAWTAAGPVDALGIDAELAASVREILRPLARRWLGFSQNGSANLLNSANSANSAEGGGVLVLLNRSAWPLPVEALALWALLGDGSHGSRRVLAMWDADLPDLPYVSDFLRKIGVVAATPANAAALLERGHIVIAFPEGRAASAKTYDRRYRLTRFELAGLFDAAIGCGAQVVPAAMVGNEESFALLGRLAGLPVTAQFPLFGLLGLLPLPVRWTLRLGPAIDTATIHGGPEAGAGLAEAVRVRMQAMLGELLAARAG